MSWQYEEWRIEDICYWEMQDCISQYEIAFAKLVPEHLLLAQDACRLNAAQRRNTAHQNLELHRSQADKAFQEKKDEAVKEAFFQHSIALEKLKNDSVFHRWPYLRSVARFSMEMAGDTRVPSNAVLTEHLPIRFRQKQMLLQLQIDRLKAALFEKRVHINTLLAAEYKKITQECTDAYEAEMRQINAWEQAELARLEEKYRTVDHDALAKQHKADLARLEKKHCQMRTEAKQQRETYQSRLEKGLTDIEEKYQRIFRTLSFNDAAVEILQELLREHFRQVVTPLQGKKVFCDLKQFDLEHSSLETGKRSKDGGYIRSGISWKIPDNAKYVRFFVYWKDPERVDIDLHAGGTMLSGDHLHVGWNADFRNGGVVHSGDVTYSDSAEYIDIDLSAPIQEISANVSLFSGKRGFRDIQTCYVGMMVVDQIGQCVKHYSPKNCFFTHKLTQNVRSLFYGFVDVHNRCVRFVGQPNACSWDSLPRIEDTFSLQDYLDCVLEAQQVQIVHCPEDSDVILSMGKSLSKKGISLVDSNFFLEC